MRQRAAVFLITFSGLVFEIGLTRIYSATIWYHFAFVAISVALLGWGLGGMCVHLLKKPMPATERAALFRRLTRSRFRRRCGCWCSFPSRRRDCRSTF